MTEDELKRYDTMETNEESNTIILKQLQKYMMKLTFMQKVVQNTRLNQILTRQSY